MRGQLFVFTACLALLGGACATTELPTGATGIDLNAVDLNTVMGVWHGTIDASDGKRSDCLLVIRDDASWSISTDRLEIAGLAKSGRGTLLLQSLDRETITLELADVRDARMLRGGSSHGALRFYRVRRTARDAPMTSSATVVAPRAVLIAPDPVRFESP